MQRREARGRDHNDRPSDQLAAVNKGCGYAVLRNGGRKTVNGRGHRLIATRRQPTLPLRSTSACPS